jgi:tryptophan synthase alpha chain
MTYFNIFEHMGETAPERLRDSGFSGVIVPDLSFEEGEEWRSTCASVGLANIMMFAPSTPRERVTTLAQASTGFCYASARMAVTGAAEDIGEAPEVVKMIREATATPVLVGIGLTTPLLGAQAAKISDGAIVGSALVRRTLDGVGPEGVEEFVGEFRRAIDEVSA